MQPAAKVPQNPAHKLQVKQPLPCYHYGGKHKSGDCRHKAAKCHNCGKVGHLARVCKSKSKPMTGKVPRPLQCSTSCPTNMLLEDTDDYSMYNLTGPPVKPLVVSVKLNSVDLEMELDTGASISVISEATYNRLWPKGKAPAIQESQVKTYSDEQLSVKGVIKVEVQYNDRCEQLQLVVARGNGPSLFGRDWLMKLCLDWIQLCANHVCYSLSLQGILDEHTSVFHRSWEL